MMRYVPIPIDDRQRVRPLAALEVPEADVTLWTGVLFWLTFATAAVLAPFL